MTGRPVETFRRASIGRIWPAWKCLRGHAVIANWWSPKGLVVGNWAGPGFERGPDGKLRVKQ